MTTPALPPTTMSTMLTTATADPLRPIFSPNPSVPVMCPVAPAVGSAPEASRMAATRAAIADRRAATFPFDMVSVRTTSL